MPTGLPPPPLSYEERYAATPTSPPPPPPTTPTPPAVPSPIIWCCSQTTTLHGEDIPYDPTTKPRLVSTTVVFYIWLFFGLFGGHHFYLGRPINGALWGCSLGLLGLGCLCDGARLRPLVAEANRGESRHQPYQMTCLTCCKTMCLIVFGALFVSIAVLTRGPYYFRKFDPIGCGFTSDPYEVLGVPYGTSFQTCRKAYRTLAKELHPDHNPNCDQACTDKMASVNVAFEKLKERNGASVIEDDIGEQWGKVFACIGGGGGDGNPATRERPPYGKDCADVCVDGVCETPSDQSRPECAACAACMRNGGSRRGGSDGGGGGGGGGGGSSGGSSRRKNKKKKHGNKKHGNKKHDKKKNTKRSTKEKNKNHPPNREGKHQPPTKQQRSKKTDKQPTPATGTPAQKYEYLSETLLEQWVDGVRHVVEGQMDEAAKERFGGQANTIVYFTWVYFLETAGVAHQSRASLSQQFIASGTGLYELLLCHYHESRRPSGAEENEGSNDCAWMLHQSRIDPEHEVVVMNALAVYHHVVSVLSLSRLDVATMAEYVRTVSKAMHMDVSAVVPLTDRVLDVLGVGVGLKRRRKHLQLVSAAIARQGGSSLFSVFGEEEEL